jgi:hypothetical protein
MLDRSTANLFQDDPPDRLPPEPPPALFEGDGTPAGPTVAPASRAARDIPRFTFLRVGRGARARTAWRIARHFLTALLIVLTVSRLAAGNCGSANTPHANPIMPSGPVHHRPLQPAAIAKHPLVRRPSSPARRRPRRVAASARSPSRTPPISPAVVTSTVAAPVPGETPGTRPMASTHGEGQEFGFEH